MDRRLPPTATTLARRCSAGDGTIMVPDSRVLQVYDVLKIGAELLVVTRTNDPIVGVARGHGGTVARAHAPGAAVLIIGPMAPTNAPTPPLFTEG